MCKLAVLLNNQEHSMFLICLLESCCVMFIGGGASFLHTSGYLTLVEDCEEEELMEVIDRWFKAGT